jgi:hypothetical protein
MRVPHRETLIINVRDTGVSGTVHARAASKKAEGAGNGQEEFRECVTPEEKVLVVEIVILSCVVLLSIEGLGTGSDVIV